MSSTLWNSVYFYLHFILITEHSHAHASHVPIHHHQVSPVLSQRTRRRRRTVVPSSLASIFLFAPAEHRATWVAPAAPSQDHPPPHAHQNNLAPNTAHARARMDDALRCTLPKSSSASSQNVAALAYVTAATCTKPSNTQPWL